MRRMIAIIIACVLAIVGVLFFLVFRYRDKIDRVLQMTESEMKVEQTVQNTESSIQTESDSAMAETGLSQTEAETRSIETEDQALHKEDSVYTFLQGPVAWERKAPYSGIWCEAELDGGLFSVFGCGLCDMAGIYSSLTPYECSPLDMYALARKVSDYSPSDGAGAIDWPYMKVTLEKAGFGTILREKNKKYSAFQQTVADSLCVTALISSEEDDTYWEDVPGHYVNIWHYNPKTDEVFLGDSGNPDHNRQWIPLRYIYDALAVDSSYQYLMVTSYEETKNAWKYSGIVEKWTRPSYCKEKPKSKSLLMSAAQ